MKRRAILEEAIRITCQDREDQYGKPENSFLLIADLWEMYLCHAKGIDVLSLLPKDVAVMMALMKIARIGVGQEKDDNYIDGAGYLALAAEVSK